MGNWTEQQFRDYATRRLRDSERARERMLNAANNSVGAVPDTERERLARPALGDDPPRADQGTASLGVRVHIVSFRSKALDGDNLVAGAKQLRDIIAEALGADDADPRITWEYAQIVTKGEQGTLVKIEHA